MRAHWKKGMSVFVGCALLTSGGLWIRDTAQFPIRVVTVIGEPSYLVPESVEDALSPTLQKGFLRANVFEVRRVLLSQPWIAEAEVSRKWPDTLVIRFKEQVPSAYWGEKGLFNEKGQLFWPERRPLLPLAHLSGPEGDAFHLWHTWHAMEREVKPLECHITRVLVSPRGAWQLSLSNGITLFLGKKSVESRLRRFVQAYAKQWHVLSPKIAYVDLRYPYGMAVGWRS